MPKTDDEWGRFWLRVWINLGHGLGVEQLWLALFGWRGSCFLARRWHFNQLRLRNLKPPQISKPAQASLQNSTNALLITDQRPCASKRKGERTSDVKGCALFRLRLGTGVSEAIQVLQNSGYFFAKPALTNRCDPERADCTFTHYIHQQRDGLSVTADFAPKQPKDKTLVLKQVAIWFAPGLHPYYEPEAIRFTFVKVLGPPDISNTNGSDNWGGYSGAHIQGYTYNDRRYAIILRDGGTFGPQTDGGTTNLFTLADGQRIDAINKFEALDEDVEDAYQEAKQSSDRNCIKKLKDEIRAAHRKLDSVSRLVYKSAGMLTKADEAPVNEKIKTSIGEAIRVLDECPANIDQLVGMCMGNMLVTTKGADASKTCKEGSALFKELLARLQ